MAYIPLLFYFKEKSFVFQSKKEIQVDSACVISREMEGRTCMLGSSKTKQRLRS